MVANFERQLPFPKLILIIFNFSFFNFILKSKYYQYALFFNKLHLKNYNLPAIEVTIATIRM